MPRQGFNYYVFELPEVRDVKAEYSALRTTRYLT